MLAQPARMSGLSSTSRSMMWTENSPARNGSVVGASWTGRHPCQPIAVFTDADRNQIGLVSR